MTWVQSMTEAFRYAIGVGGNVGDVAATLARAAALLTADGHVVLVARSPLVRSAPLGGPGGQPRFWNGAWIAATALGPHQLLARLQVIETACGRVRTMRWGPRICDLDLLARDDGLRVASLVLTLPHPRMHERPFVLEPLAAVGWRMSL